MNAPTWLVGLCAVLWLALIFALASRDKWRDRANRK